ncbi:hypothetical protein AAVH_25091 [Aphelenchoides avenae]|nr:hypothetical protein AAVH_25091 [Aphelenchus avenae]
MAKLNVVLFAVLVALLVLSVLTEARPQLPTMLETLHTPFGGTAYDIMYTLTCLPRVSLEACELSCRHFQRLIESTDGLALRRIPLLKVVRVKRRLGIVIRWDYIVEGYVFNHVVLRGTRRVLTLGLFRALANTSVDTLYFCISLNDTDAQVWREETSANEKAFRNMNIGFIDFFMWDRHVRTWLDVCDRLKDLGHRLDGIGWKMKVAKTYYGHRGRCCLRRYRFHYCDSATLLAPMVLGREHQLTHQLKLHYTNFTMDTLRWFIQWDVVLGPTLVLC